MSLLSSATLGQNPLAPTSALDRQDGREDLVVRRGIDRLRRQHGDGEGSGSEGSAEEEEQGGRKGKGKAREEIVDVDFRDRPVGNDPTDGAGVSGKNRRKRTKQVSYIDRHCVGQNLIRRPIGIRISCLLSPTARHLTSTHPTLGMTLSQKRVPRHPLQLRRQHRPSSQRSSRSQPYQMPNLVLRPPRKLGQRSRRVRADWRYSQEWKSEREYAR